MRVMGQTGGVGLRLLGSGPRGRGRGSCRRDWRVWMAGLGFVRRRVAHRFGERLESTRALVGYASFPQLGELSPLCRELRLVSRGLGWLGWSGFEAKLEEPVEERPTVRARGIGQSYPRGPLTTRLAEERPEWPKTCEGGAPRWSRGEELRCDGVAPLLPAGARALDDARLVVAASARAPASRQSQNALRHGRPVRRTWRASRRPYVCLCQIAPPREPVRVLFLPLPSPRLRQPALWSPLQLASLSPSSSIVRA